MYVGRLLVVAPGLGAYRVSSRSFPNRRVTDRDGTLTVSPTDDAPPTENPYVSYNCLRQVGEDARVVLGNGSHVDPVTEKLTRGYPSRDALATALLALDYEKDDYDTPRIAGVVNAHRATVGIVRRDAIFVERITEPTLVATYERDRPEPFAFEADTAVEAARAAYDLDFEHPVCAVGATVDDTVETAIVNDVG
jgi:IMP cyclohydrolase